LITEPQEINHMQWVWADHVFHTESTCVELDAGYRAATELKKKIQPSCTEMCYSVFKGWEMINYTMGGYCVFKKNDRNI